MASPLSVQQIPIQSPQQLGVTNQLLGQVNPLIQQLSKGIEFEPIAQQARTQFQTQTLPSIAERFSSLGGSSRGSSNLRGALGAAGSGLEEALAALGAQFGLQQQGQQQNLLRTLLGYGLQPGFENVAQQEGPGFLGGLAGGAGQGIGALIPLLSQLLGGGQAQGQQEQLGRPGTPTSSTSNGLKLLVQLLPTLIGAAVGGPGGAAAGSLGGSALGNLLGSTKIG